MATQKLIMAFVTLVIGIALIGVITTETGGVTSQDATLNETIDLTDYKSGMINVSGINTTLVLDLDNAYTTSNWQYDDGQCTVAVTSYAMDNATEATAGTDYNITANGGLALFDSGFWHTESASNTTYITYTACQDDYMTLGWGRSILNIVPGFFAIALLMVSLGLFYSIAKDTGII